MGRGGGSGGSGSSGGRSGGSSGSGRSSGSHSFSGRSSVGGRGGGSSSSRGGGGGSSRGGGSPGGYSGGGYGYGGGGPHPGYRGGYDTGPRYGSRRYYGGGRYYYYGGGIRFLNALVVIIVLLIVVFIVYSARGGLGSNITASTQAREPLAKGIASQTEYIRDDARWLGSAKSVESSMKYFYSKTGVQPYLWIADVIDDRKDLKYPDLEQYMEQEYQEMFSDEGHMIVMFYEPYEGEYETAILVGSAARTVIDAEAQEIILDYLDSYYYDDGLDDAGYFNKVFTKSADRLMEVTKPWYSGLIAFVVVAIVVIVILLVFIRMLKRKAEKRRADAELLNADVSEIGGADAASRLADKYDDRGL